eukprot:TRINITY_DN16462_c0_g1_i1.p1 TRINITY_DN16462_c0_g1~~TRINITY_DN16462_c0_g1_i1.p1  ORF type:complete len:668 (+),score=337.03 TRINITY_DN16462_c0_g1_i1:253-2256(+)
MAEVDGIILTQLRGLNTSLAGLLADVKVLSDVESAVFYQAVHACIEGMDTDAARGLSETLPQSRSQRFQACTNIAGVVQQLGYPKTITFNQFMYPAESDTRSILNWLFQQQQTTESTGLQSGAAAGGSSPLAEAAWSYLEDKAKAVGSKLKEAKKEARVVIPPLRGAYPVLTAAAKKRDVVPVAEAVAYRSVAGEELKPFLAPGTDEEDAWCEQHVPACARQPQDGRVKVLHVSLAEYNAALYAKERIQERELEALGGISKKEYRQRKKEQRATLLAAAAAAATPAQQRAAALRQAEAESTAPSAKSRFLKEQSYNTTAASVEAPAADAEDEAKPAVDKESEEEALQRRREEERKELKRRLRETSAKMKSAAEEAQRLEDEMLLLEDEKASSAEQAKGLGKDGDHMEGMLNTYLTALELCDDEEGQGKLMERLQEAADAIAQLEEEWQVKEAKLLAKYEAAKADYDDASLKTQAVVEELASAKADLKELRAEVKAKGDLREQLEAEAEKAAASESNREYYSGRIVLLNKNLMKEQREVEKISDESRNLIRETEGLYAGLKRAFAATEEKCYTETKKLDQSNVSYGVAVYQEIISLRESFTHLIGTVEQQASTRQLLHEVSEKVEKQTTRNSSLNTDAVEQDLAEIQGENATLSQELKQLRSQIKQLL